jgi:hypothetical protein
MPSSVSRLLIRAKIWATTHDEDPTERSSQRSSHGIVAAPVEELEGTPFERLSPAEVESRIAAATGKLRELEAFEDITQVPMRHLADDQLAYRLHRVETELERLGETEDPTALQTAVDRELVLRHLEALDHLVEHPNSSIPPNWALDDEPSLWAKEFETSDRMGSTTTM